jgi:hypothetical protein
LQKLAFEAGETKTSLPNNVHYLLSQEPPCLAFIFAEVKPVLAQWLESMFIDSMQQDEDFKDNNENKDPQKRRSYDMDGYRRVAAILVPAVHLSSQQGNPPKMMRFKAEEKEQAKQEKHNLKKGQ